VSKLQRIILLAAAAIISLLTWYTFAEGYIDGVEWLYPLLAVAGLLFWAARGLRPTSTHLQNDKATPALPSTDEARRRASLEAEASRMVESTDRLAERIFKLTKPPSLPGHDGTELLRWKTHRAQGNFRDLADQMQAELEADCMVRAVTVAYSLHWYRPLRKVRQRPPQPEFFAYRQAIKKRLLDFVANSPEVGDSIAEMTGGEIKPPDVHHETFVTNLLDDADERRMETEQDSHLRRLLEPALDSALFADRNDLTKGLLEIMKTHWDVGSAPH
jgi:hypothetical protein